MLCNATVRTDFRQQFHNKFEDVKNIFRDEYGEFSFKKILDVEEIAQKLNKAGLQFEPEMQQVIGGIFMCFGDIECTRTWGDRIPEETPE